MELGKVPSYRMEQLRHWIFEQGLLGWQMTNLPKSLRDEIPIGIWSHGTFTCTGLVRYHPEISLET